MNKLLIIDGHNLLFQMYYGMPSRIINKDGKAIQGTLGFIGALLKIIRKINPSHLVVVFDGEIENARTSLDVDYKQNRIYDELDNPFTQLVDIYKALDFMKIKYFECVKIQEAEFCEADDVISAYVFNYHNDSKIIISSFDSDFFQLINDNVSILRYRGDKTIICDEEYIYNKFKIHPRQYVDFKSLIGDGADNIKGVRGIGPVTAAKLLNEFKTIDNLITNMGDQIRPTIKKSILESINRIRLNQRLIRLNGDYKLPHHLEKLEISEVIQDKITTNDVLTGINLR